MNPIDLLAKNLNIKSNKPNQDLAVEIIKSKRQNWVKELDENSTIKIKIFKYLIFIL